MQLNRRYLTFSLRSLFILLTAFAIWLGVVVNRAREQREAVKAIEALGGTVAYDWQFAATPMSMREYGYVVSGAAPAGPPWLRQIIGDEYFQEVVFVDLVGGIQITAGVGENVPSVPEADIRASIPYLKRLRGLESILSLKLSDATLHELKNALPNVEIRNYFTESEVMTEQSPIK